MADTIKNDMFGKIKEVKDLAAKALGKVDLGSKVLKTPEVKKANAEEVKTSNNLATESDATKDEVKGKLLSKLVAPKKANAKTEEPTTKSKLVEESSEKQTEVKKVPDEETKAKEAKALGKIAKADTDATKV